MSRQEDLILRDLVAEEKRHWVRVTKVCNNNCLFCHDTGNQDGTSIAYEEIVKELKSGFLGGAKRVIISGGEPTLHPDVVKIISQAKKIGYTHVQMISNGRMFAYDDFAEKLKKAGLDEVTVSLHSHNKQILEEIIGVKGVYEQTMKGLLNVIAHNLIVSIDIVVTKLNYKTLSQTLNFFIKLGVYEFDILYLVPFGQAWHNRKKLFFNYGGAKKYLDKAWEFSKIEGVHLWTNRWPARNLENYEWLIQSPHKLNDDVLGMRQQFLEYIKVGRLMSCHGERCDICYMNDFCKDLIKLRTIGVLGPKARAKCQRATTMQTGVAKFSPSLDINEFTEFYIKNRYFVKSIRCQKCVMDKDCDGVHINEIRNKSFKIIKPF
ncbi:radical SAM protein [Candidatus Parcubacteria bacterium]|nr:radical SAM protein [Patescibacteria group bacterium]MBU4309574.1 radical SAM protein [Patescibacteria group bacterium]MBU4432259.1 radical SAM protein [Patescibacteria group bacterium]MBU4578038.1 radical SAM protein [Patescibacteria group bacterium]MCG2696454.1 radical SAM protein [Candidatus Parcubacteria bacterium]